MFSSNGRGTKSGQSSTLVLSEGGGDGGGGFALGSFTELANEFRTLDHGEEVKKPLAKLPQPNRTRATDAARDAPDKSPPTGTVASDRTRTTDTSRELSEEVSQMASEVDTDGPGSGRSQTAPLMVQPAAPALEDDLGDLEEPDGGGHGVAFFCGLGGSLRRNYTEIIDNRDTILKICRMTGYWADIHWLLVVAGHFLGWQGWSHVVCYLALGETLVGVYVDYHIVRLLARLAQGPMSVYNHPEEICSRRWQLRGCDTCVSVWMAALFASVLGLPDELLDAGVVGLTFGEGPWSVTPQSSELIDDLGVFGWIFHIGIGWALLVALDLSLCLQASVFFRSKRRVLEILDDTGRSEGGSESSALSCLVDMADLASLNMSSEVIKRMKINPGQADFSNNACFYTKTFVQNSFQLSFSVSLLHLVHHAGDSREVANVLMAMVTGTAVTLASTKSFVQHGLTDASSHSGARCCCGLFFVVPVVAMLVVAWVRLAIMFL